MSLQQQARGERYVIDLTDGPVMDLAGASFFSSSRVELEEAANRLLMTLPSPASAATPYTWNADTIVPRHRSGGRGMRIDMATVLGITAVSAAVIFLLGLIGSALY
jgi:hypothetical protein